MKPKREPTIHNCYKENKIPRNTINKECKGRLQGELQTTAQRNKREHKQMEKHSMFMVRKNQYRENGQTAKSNLWIQCYPHQATSDLLHRTGKNHHELHMEPQESPLSQVNSTQKEHSGGLHTTLFQTILQGYSNQNSMVLVPKQRYRPMEQNRGLRGNISTTIQYLINLTKTSNRERIPCLINGVGKTG